MSIWEKIGNVFSKLWTPIKDAFSKIGEKIHEYKVHRATVKYDKRVYGKPSGVNLIVRLIKAVFQGIYAGIAEYVKLTKEEYEAEKAAADMEKAKVENIVDPVEDNE